MAIEPNQYYPKQMNGPVISANGYAVNAEFTDAETIEAYLYNLSIDTANETELENIGRLIGYTRPLVPEGFNAENIFLFGSEPLTQDALIGFSTVDSQVGGQLTSIVLDETNYMDLGTYRKFLKAVAVIKRYGITLKSVDLVAATISQNYEIEFDENADITVNFLENIGFKNIWLLTQLFYRIATEPQILITAEEGE